MGLGLGELEAHVMDLLWRSEEPLTVRQVFDQLAAKRPRAYTTVLTVLDNLHRKGYVSRRPTGRAYLYRASRTREDHVAELIDGALKDTSDRSAGILHFIQRLSPDEVAAVRAGLAQMCTARPRGNDL